MELLILLVEHRDRLVEREEIAARLWPDARVVDVEQGINAAIKRLRAVLNEDVAKPRFIQTVVGRGYRFIADVEEVVPETPSLTAAVSEPPQDPPALNEPELVVPVRTPRKQLQRSVFSASLVTVALLLALGTLVSNFFTRRHRTAAMEKPIFRQVTTLIPENRATAAAVSPDGSLTAYANADGVFLQTSDGETTALHAPANFVCDQLAWFSTGTKLVASGFSDRTHAPAIWLVFVTGGAPRLLRMHASNGSPSPDGTRIAFVSEDRSSIWIMGVNGEQPQRVLDGSGQDTFPLVFWPCNKRLAFQRRQYAPRHRPPDSSAADTRWDVYYDRTYESLELATGKIVARVPDLWIESAAALPDGVMIFLRWNPPGSRSLQLWEVRTDPATGVFLETPREVFTLPEHDERLYMAGMSASRDGKEILVLRQSSQYAVFVGDFSANPPRISDRRRLTLDERTDFPHAWTRDSRAVIFESDRYGNYRIFKQEVDRRTAEPIVSTAQQPEVLPQMWPGGEWVLYRTWAPAERYSNSKLMRVLVEGGTPEEVPIGGPLDEFRCAIGSGSRCVLRVTIPGACYVFYDLNPITGKGRELARTKWLPGVLGDWDISPDGQEIAIPNHSSRDARIRLISLQPVPRGPREREVQVAGITNLSSLTSAADGSGWFVPLDTSVGSRLLYVWRDGRSTSLGDIPGWAVPSPDGRRVAFLNQIMAANAWLLDRSAKGF